MFLGNFVERSVYEGRKDTLCVLYTIIFKHYARLNLYRTLEGFFISSPRCKVIGKFFFFLLHERFEIPGAKIIASEISKMFFETQLTRPLAKFTIALNGIEYKGLSLPTK